MTYETILDETEQISEMIKEQPPIISEEEGFIIRTFCGMNGVAKHGRYSVISFEITNTRENREGMIQVILPYAGENIVYETKYELLEGETKEYNIPILVSDWNELCYVSLTNKIGKSILKKEVRYDVIVESSDAIIGVLIKKPYSYQYLKKENTKLLYFDQVISNKELYYYDLFDAILIQQSAFIELSKKDWNILYDWVRAGGNLIFDSTITRKQILSAFPKEQVLFSVVESLQIELSESSYQLSLAKIGFGHLLSYSCPMEMDDTNYKIVGTWIYESIQQNLSGRKQYQQFKGNPGYYFDYSIYNGLSSAYNKRIPTIGKYFIALLIYIFFSGPILYLLLRKFKKTEYMWGFVPISSILFTIIIYILGSNTRVTKPYIIYQSYVELDESGTSSEVVYFGTASPNNQKYEVELPGDYLVIASNNYGYYNGSNVSSEQEAYTEKIIKSREKNTIEMRDKPSFETSYFTAVKQDKISGSYKANFTSSTEGVRGVFENQLGYNLKGALLLYNNKICTLGEIKDKEIVQLDGTQESTFITRNQLYSSSFQDIVKQANGFLSQTELNYKTNVLTSLLDRDMSDNRFFHNNYFIAFLEEENHYVYFDESNISANGTTVIVIPFSISYEKDGITYEPMINKYGTIIEGSIDEYSDSFLEEEVIIEYHYNKEQKVNSIQYRSDMNLEFNKQYSKDLEGFDGEIYFYNYTTRQYDFIFTSGIEGIKADLSCYVNKDNSIRIKYKIKETRKEHMYLNKLPQLSIEWEKDINVGN